MSVIPMHGRASNAVENAPVEGKAEGTGAQIPSPVTGVQSEHRLSPARKAAHAPAARALARALSRCKGGQAGFARKLGSSGTSVSRWCDDSEEGRPVALRDVFAGGPALLRELAAEMAAYADALDGTRPMLPSLDRAVVLGQAEAGDVARAFADAMADGVRDPEELRRIAAESREAEAAFAKVAASAERELNGREE